MRKSQKTKPKQEKVTTLWTHQKIPEVGSGVKMEKGSGDEASGTKEGEVSTLRTHHQSSQSTWFTITVNVMKKPLLSALDWNGVVELLPGKRAGVELEVVLSALFVFLILVGTTFLQSEIQLLFFSIRFLDDGERRIESSLGKDFNYEHVESGDSDEEY